MIECDIIMLGKESIAIGRDIYSHSSSAHYALLSIMSNDILNQENVGMLCVDIFI